MGKYFILPERNQKATGDMNKERNMDIEERIKKLERFVEDPTINGCDLSSGLYDVAFLTLLETNLVYCLQEIKKLREI